jgi:hypothetical protein
MKNRVTLYLFVLLLLVSPLMALDRSVERQQEYLSHLQRILNLSPDQSRAIQGFLRDTRAEVSDINRDSGLDELTKTQRTKAAFRNSRDRVRSVLTQDQLSVFDAYQKEQWSHRRD